MNESFIPHRITELRLARNISEYQMSLELGMSKGYIQGITSGKTLPSVRQLFNIVDYFGLTMAEFFNEGQPDPPVLQGTVHQLRQLDEADIALVYSVAERIARDRQKEAPDES